MDLLGGYVSGEDEHSSAPSSSDSEASTSSVDSAEERARAADARLRNYGDTTIATSRQEDAKGLLPSALAAFNTVNGPPSFLDPEATRQLATCDRHGLSEEQLAALDAAAMGKASRVKQAPGKDFDISVLAPRLRGQVSSNPDKRDLPAGCLIEGKAKRYKPEEEGQGVISAAIIAMMGGHVREDGGEAAAAVAAKAKSGPTTAMPVSDFLDKGLGGVQLPRKNADRKDREKDKRMKGQSTHASWKTEAEMVLRQQFDS